jgi:acyl-CoA dehydrogenase
MDLELNDDQLELREIADAFLKGRGDLAPARAMLDGAGEPRGLCAEVAELGWFAVGIDPDDPFGIPGLCLLAERVGAHATPLPLVDSAVAARLVGGGGELADVAAGEAPAALAVVEGRGGWGLRNLSAAEADGADGVRLTATKLDVHHAELARAFVAIADLDGEPVAVAVAAGSAGVEVGAASSLDPSCATATVAFDGVAAEAAIGGEQLRAALAVGTVATAAEAVGAASRSLAMAVEYAKEREQFGRPIGSFQALQHLLAEMYVKRETAWSSVLFAAAALEEGLDEAPRAVAVAKAHGCRASREIVEGALQVLGGIGFTWEHDVHLLQRRVLDCERRYGDAIDQAQALSPA